MSNRLIKIKQHYYAWPVGTHKPTTFAISEALLAQFIAKNGEHRVAGDAETQAALQANQAGPANRKLSEDELNSCYRDNLAYERFFAKEGVELRSFAVN